MPYAAIIAEYNPFHNGHLYHINATKSAGADGVAVVLSGNYTQRGYPALMPREYRAQAAILNGADLIIELPAPWSCASAQVFAEGAVGIADSLGIFDYLSFGSGAESTKDIIDLSEITSGEDFSRLVSERHSCGVSYPRAVAEAINNSPEWNKYSYLIEDANAVLACEYVKALSAMSSSVQPLNIKRVGAAHGDSVPEKNTASASWLRNEIYKSYNVNKELYGLYNMQDYIPYNAFNVMMKSCEDGVCPIDRDKFSLSSLTALRTLSAQNIMDTFESAEGLENRIKRAVMENDTFEKAADAAKTKRFTHSRIRRVMLSSYLGATKEYYKNRVPYARVMAMNEKGCEMLKEASIKTRIPIITRIPKLDTLEPFAEEIFKFNAKAESLYNLCLPKARDGGTYYTTKIFKYML